MRKTYAVVAVARVLVGDPDARHWGYDLARRTGLGSGVVGPVLGRFAAAGWVSDERVAECADRPARRYFSLTDAGRAALGAWVAGAEGDPRFGPPASSPAVRVPEPAVKALARKRAPGAAGPPAVAAVAFREPAGAVSAGRPRGSSGACKHPRVLKGWCKDCMTGGHF